MHNEDMKAQQDCIKKWAYKKMQKLEKKLKWFAGIYFGEPMIIIYARNGAVVVHKDGSESVLKAGEKDE